MEGGHYEMASFQYTRAIEFTEENAEEVEAAVRPAFWYCHRGKAFVELKQLDLAAADAQMCIDLEPKYIGVCSTRQIYIPILICILRMLVKLTRIRRKNHNCIYK